MSLEELQRIPKDEFSTCFQQVIYRLVQRWDSCLNVVLHNPCIKQKKMSNLTCIALIQSLIDPSKIFRSDFLVFRLVEH